MSLRYRLVESGRICHHRGRYFRAYAGKFHGKRAAFGRLGRNRVMTGSRMIVAAALLAATQRGGEQSRRHDHPRTCHHPVPPQSAKRRALPVKFSRIRAEISPAMMANPPGFYKAIAEGHIE